MFNDRSMSGLGGMKINTAIQLATYTDHLFAERAQIQEEFEDEVVKGEKIDIDEILSSAKKGSLQARDFSRKKRKALAKKGYAMADGSYPIVTSGDLENAVQAYGRSPDQATKNHIIKRAHALGRTDLLPDKWKK
ncbi:MAG: hypothetical protein KGI50_07540 [Patescibacteria group bacterium]|nr:hypothetical protein [Patescibacteria group bacterium]MDE2438937.1 hypothetical protein [Patescibacteria group bacterium]